MRQLSLKPSVLVVVVEPGQILSGLIPGLGHDVIRQMYFLLPSVVLIGHAEIQLVHGLGSPLGEFRTDGHHGAHACDLVTGIAALVHHKGLAHGSGQRRVFCPLARESCSQTSAALFLEEPASLLLKHLPIEALTLHGPTFRSLPEYPIRVFHDVCGDVRCVPIIETQVRHLGATPIRLGVLDPSKEPFSADLGIHAPQVGTVLIVAPDLFGEVVGDALFTVIGSRVMATVTAHQIHHLTPALCISHKRQGREVLLFVVGKEEFGDCGNSVVVPLATHDRTTLAVF